ncbi:MAG: hypothetical protein GY711_04070 [bacterium]|nr:hypothetical protein [bacterium]
MERRLERQLLRVDERLSSVRAERVSAVTWTVFAILAAALFASRSALDLSLLRVAGLLIGTAAVAVLALRAIAARRRSDPIELARFVERESGVFDSSLLAAAELQPDLPDGRYGFLATRLIDQVLEGARRRPWTELVPAARVRTARGLHAAGAIAFAVAVGFLALAGRAKDTGASALVTSMQPASFAVTILPGDAEVERGRGILVSARYTADDVPSEVDLVTTSTDGGEVERLAMTRSLDDPVFGLRLSNIDADLVYRVEWEGRASDSYRLTVFEHPELVRSDVELHYPAFTGLEDRTVEDTRRVTVPQGTELTLLCRFNKDVASALLVDPDTQNEIELVGAREARATLVLTESIRYALLLTDAEGRTNQKPTAFVFKVTDNRRPDLRLTSARDVRVSPIEELTVGTRASDDYALERYGVSVRVGAEEPVEVVLGAGSKRGETILAEHTIALEELEVVPAQLVSYHFWAEDRGADSVVRRTSSDLFFAEVRPFEEIYREGQEAPGGAGAGEGGEGGEQDEGGAGGGANPRQVAELQRDVSHATWNVIRRIENGESDTADDLAVVRESQESAREQLDQLGENPLAQSDATQSGLLERISTHMDGALEDLERGAQTQTAEPLHEALTHEQAANQALLEFAENEFEVARANEQQNSQQSGRAGQQGGPSQDQLQQLELENTPNRYETQRTAGERSSLAESASETRAALDRLKELARRQEDLNERLRELQAELLAADTEQEREEIERRLKRLQEAEEEILRDTDELQQQMESATEPSRLADERQQLERARDTVQRTSEALEEGRVDQALAEGSRAEREMRELEQELRDATGQQFDERMREMQREARRMEREQERIAQELRELNDQGSRPAPSLREREGREELTQAFEEQEDRLEQLLDDVEETVQDAETTEPLLAEELFDTLNDARDARADEALETARDMLERGFPREAREAERGASEGVAELREGIERAAESVLGSGVEALTRAQEELERLSEELESELADARGETSAPQPGRPPGEEAGQAQGEQPPGQPQPGQQPGQQPGRGGEQPSPQPGQGRARGPRPSLAGGDPRETGPRGPETAGTGGRGGERFEPARPLTGEDEFRDWSERLREVEEMIDDPDLSAEAANLRSRARQVREDVVRHSQEPDWELVDEKIARPLAELHERVSEEVRRRRVDDNLVPIDRDPVPPEFAESVRRYYESLGRGK